MEVTRWI